MKNTPAFVWIVNLHNAAQDHNRLCKDVQCVTSLYLLKDTATALLAHVDDTEKIRAREYIAGMP